MWYEDIQNAVTEGNQTTNMALAFSAAIGQINAAITDGGADLLSALTNKHAAITNINTKCAANYTKSLSDARHNKSQTG